MQAIVSGDSNSKNHKSPELLRIAEVNSLWFLDLGAKSLSGGQKKQLALIRALSSKPDLLILDEFPAGLDFDKSTRILGNLRKEYPGMTLIMTSHESGYEKFFDEVLVIEND
jgi:ABC-type multidrug transport system ATPase subunit